MALPAERRALFEQVAARGAACFRQIVQAAPAERRPSAERSLSWIMDFDLPRMERRADIPVEPETHDDKTRK